MNNQHEFDPEKQETILFSLKDPDIQAFIREFFEIRYNGLITPSTQKTIGYSNTKTYVSAIIESLLNDPGHTRHRFFGSSESRSTHSLFRARNGAQKWLFEVTAIWPFLQGLADGARILDIGAGDNSFLERLKKAQNRDDIDYLGVDLDMGPDTETDNVKFQLQPGEYDTGVESDWANVIILKAAAHHISDPARMLTEIKRVMARGGLLILIEESSDNEPPSAIERLHGMTDEKLNGIFYSMSVEKRLLAMKFLDYYGVRIYRGWDDMPLPLGIRDLNGWISLIQAQGLNYKTKVNMGFAKPEYVSCLQRCNLVMVFTG